MRSGAHRTGPAARVDVGYLLVGVGAAGLGVFFAAGAYLVRVLPGYARISPRFFPILVGVGLIAVGALVMRDALRGGRPAGSVAPNWRAVGVVALGLLLYTGLVERAGFILASTLLLAVSAYGLGSRRILANLLAGFVVSAAAYMVFTRALGLRLPVGLLG